MDHISNINRFGRALAFAEFVLFTSLVSTSAFSAQEQPLQLVHHDRPPYYMMGKDSSPAGLVSNQTLKIGAKDGCSYGAFINQFMKKKNNKIVASTQSNTGLTRMLVGKWFDFIFSPGDEVESVLKESGELSKKLKIMNFRDMSDENKRYLQCNQQDSDETIIKFNVTLEATRK